MKFAPTRSREWHKAHRADKLFFANRIARKQIADVRKKAQDPNQNYSLKFEPVKQVDMKAVRLARAAAHRQHLREQRNRK